MEIKKDTEIVDIPCPTCRGRGTIMKCVVTEQDGVATKFEGHPQICPRCHGSKTIQATINKLNIEE